MVQIMSTKMLLSFSELQLDLINDDMIYADSSCQLLTLQDDNRSDYYLQDKISLLKQIILKLILRKLNS